MRLLIITCIIICIIFKNNTNAQTAAIFHKSHSGSAATVPTVVDGGFGEYTPPYTLLKVIKINDSMAVKVTMQTYIEGTPLVFDTLRGHSHFLNSKIKFEDLKKMYPEVIFEGYETKGIKRHNKNAVKTAKKQGLAKSFRSSKRVALGVSGILLLCGMMAFVQYRQAKNETKNEANA